MMRLALPLLLVLAACGEQERGEPPAGRPAIENLASAASAPRRSTALLPVPADKAQLARMQSAGYTVHEDHLHEPGVTACPMDMGSNPVQ